MTTTTTRSTGVTATSYEPSAATRIVAGVTRLALGWVFLWAFLDKTFGLGYATPSDAAWLDGGSPTTGYLSGVEGPFADFFNGMAGAAWADWLFMLGLLGIGLGLVLGIFMNLAALSGAVMLVFMWMASLPLANNPFMDDHLVYAALGILLALMGAGRWLGLGAVWERLPLVRKAPVLR
jgi:thiosulfate dehydrogenase [quinone] large subunit